MKALQWKYCFFYRNIALLKIFLGYRTEFVDLQKKFAIDRFETKICITRKDACLSGLSGLQCFFRPEGNIVFSGGTYYSAEVR